jgi:hypothetical protein
MKRKLRLSLIVFFIVTISGCVSYREYRAPRVLPDDTRDIPEPKYQKINYGHDAYNKIVTHTLDQTFDVCRQMRHILNKPKQAMNVDAFEEVIESSWFTNRNARKHMSLEAIARGPNTGSGPDTSSPWKIIQAKVEGITPGFQIEDSLGNRYLIKFDPIGYSELVTGAEVVCTKIFYAAGYNVPENYITYFDPSLLRIGDNVEFVDEYGRMRMMVPQDIEAILKKIEHLPDDRYRALASKYLEGKILGGFRYKGTRKDDPNDIVPHEFRRELRGLYVLCAWLKHFDTKGGNNLDVYVDENGKRFVKHYLIDFGATLGSATTGPQSRHKGHEYDFDLPAVVLNLMSFGVHVRDWEKLGDVQYPSIGRFDSHDFNPRWSRPNYPNPAFDNCTNLDGYWGAKLVMSFTDEQLEKIVEQGQYSNPDASAYLVKILKERRDITGRFWYSRVNPLDKFKVIETSPGNQELIFSDLGVEGNLWTEDQSRYQYDFSLNNIELKRSFNIDNKKSISLKKLEKMVDQNQKLNRPVSAEDQWVISLKVKRDHEEKWSKWTKVYLSRDPVSGEFTLLGIRRQN